MKRFPAVRLDKRLTECGYGSRSDCVRLLKRGLVTVNGSVVKKGNQKVTSTDLVCVDGIPVQSEPPVYLWHKPVGVHSTVGDPLGRLSISECEPNVLLPRYHPVGRLDADTSGLLLFSQVGALTQRLLHPKHEIPRRYRVCSEAVFTVDHQQRLEAGVTTSLGVFSGKVVSLENNELELIVTEGKHRMVRRMLANVERPVVALVRLSYGPFELGALSPGELRTPTLEETQEAKRLGLPGF